MPRVHLMYAEGINSRRAKVQQFNGSAWEVGTAGFSPGRAFTPKLALDASDIPYVAYGDGQNDFKATVQRFNGSTWESGDGRLFGEGRQFYLART